MATTVKQHRNKLWTSTGVLICVNAFACRWLWSAPAARILHAWTSWWSGSCTAAASPAVRKASRRGRWCSSIQQTTPWIQLRLYPTPWSETRPTLCPTQTACLTSRPTLSRTTIPRCPTRQTEARATAVMTLCSPSLLLLAASSVVTLRHFESFFEGINPQSRVITMSSHKHYALVCFQ